MQLAMRTSTNPAMANAQALNAFAVRTLAGLGNTTPGVDGPASQAPPNNRFDWGGLVNQSFDFAKTFLTLRPAAGTVVTTGPGGIQVARGTDGQPVNYTASNTLIGGNVGAGVGVGLNASGLNTNVLLVGAVLLVGVLLIKK
jgi:hypothetical protein